MVPLQRARDLFSPCRIELQSFATVSAPKNLCILSSSKQLFQGSCSVACACDRKSCGYTEPLQCSAKPVRGYTKSSSKVMFSTVSWTRADSNTSQQCLRRQPSIPLERKDNQVVSHRLSTALVHLVRLSSSSLHSVGLIVTDWRICKTMIHSLLLPSLLLQQNVYFLSFPFQFKPQPHHFPKNQNTIGREVLQRRKVDSICPLSKVGFTQHSLGDRHSHLWAIHSLYFTLICMYSNCGWKHSERWDNLQNTVQCRPHVALNACSQVN